MVVAGLPYRLMSMKTIKLYLLIIGLGLVLMGCNQTEFSDLSESNPFNSSPKAIARSLSLEVGESKLTETLTPKVVRELNKNLEFIAPQISIASPQNNQILNDTSVAVKLNVQNLPLFRDEQLGMGPNLHLILDNEPYRSIYSVDEPIILDNLTPGTHTIRVFAARPWHESFKNEGAYAQTTFSILTKTNDNTLDPNLPLLTYNVPSGVYRAEPILLDFYLTNAPLHVVARENPNDEIKDWRIRVTVNGESFILDEWQPIYLQGFERGNNWVQLELLDEEGNNIENAFNNTVRLVTYDPKEQNTLAKLVTGKLSAEQARPIVVQDYEIPVVETPEITEPEIEEETIEEETSETVEEIPRDFDREKVEPELKTDTEIEAEVAPLETNIEAEEAEEAEEPIEVTPPETNSPAEIVAPETTTSEIEPTETEPTETEPDVVIEVITNADSNSASVEESPSESTVVVEKTVDESEKLARNESTSTISQPKFKLPDWIGNISSTLKQKIQELTQQLSNRISSL